MAGKVVKFTLTVETSETVAETAEAFLMKQAEGLLGRLTRVEYEDHGDHRMETSRRTLRKIGRDS